MVAIIVSIHALLAESDEPTTSRYNKHNMFLSTLSLRRATDVIAVMTEAQSVSIHALLAESDSARPEIRQPYAVSIHALLAESDLHRSGHCGGNRVSIHALLAESDARGMLCSWFARKFLSTLSLRRATFVNCMPLMLIWFLSTLSLRRATMERRSYTLIKSKFLSTLSLRRATGSGYSGPHR